MNMHRGRSEARTALVSEYFADLHEAWQAKGKAVLETVAMLYPDVFLRVVASHMPREMHATVTNIKLERLSNAELARIILEESRSSEDPALSQESLPSLQRMGES